MEPEKKILAPNTPKHNVAQTYAEDMAQVLSDGKGGVIKRIIHSEEEHEKEKRNLSPQSRKNKFFMFLGMVLLLVSAGTIAFFLKKGEVPSVPVEKQFVPIIFTDKNALIELADLKKSEIEEKISNQVNTTTVKEGGVEGIYPTLNKSPVGLNKFMALLGGSFAPAPENFVDDNFLMGVYKNDSQSGNFFMLIKMRSIPDVFDIMRKWESKMFTDLHGFFGVSLSPETKYLLTKEFQNSIIENKNARILYDTDNNIVMMYIFSDDNSIVITDNPKAVAEIILRLASSQIKK